MSTHPLEQFGEPTTAAEQAIPPEPVAVAGNPLADGGAASVGVESSAGVAPADTTVPSSTTASFSSAIPSSTAVLRTSSPAYGDAAGSSGKRSRAGSVTDLELAFNLIKIALYFLSIAICALPALSDAASFPVEDDDELDEADRPYPIVTVKDADGAARRHAIVPGTERDAATAKSVTAPASSADNDNNKKKHGLARWQALKKKFNSAKRTTLQGLRIFAALGATCLCTWTTWNYIIEFLLLDMAKYSSVKRWLVKSDWFTAAYLLVTESASQYFISSQLLFFVCPWVLWLVIEFARSPQRNRFFPLCILWVGCAAAISAALPLAWQAVSVSIESRPDRCARYSVPFRPLVLAPIVVAFVGVILLPLNVPAQSDDPYATTEPSSAFGAILAVTHIGVVIPALLAQFFPQHVSVPAQRSVISSEDKEKEKTIVAVPQNICGAAQREWLSRTASALWIPISFSCFALGCGIMHLVHLNEVVQNVEGDMLLATLVAAFSKNPCQTSISLDVIQCSLLVVVFLWSGICGRLRWGERVAMTLLLPFVSLGCVFSAAVAIEELRVFFERMEGGFQMRFQCSPATLAVGSSSSNGSTKAGEATANVAAAAATSTSTAKAAGTPLDISPRSSSPNLGITSNSLDLDSTFELKPGKSTTSAQKRSAPVAGEQVAPLPSYSKTKGADKHASSSPKQKQRRSLSGSGASAASAPLTITPSSSDNDEDEYDDEEEEEEVVEYVPKRSVKRTVGKPSRRPIASPEQQRQRPMKRSSKRRHQPTDSEESDVDSD